MNDEKKEWKIYMPKRKIAYTPKLLPVVASSQRNHFGKHTYWAFALFKFFLPFRTREIKVVVFLSFFFFRMLFINFIVLACGNECVVRAHFVSSWKHLLVNSCAKKVNAYSKAVLYRMHWNIYSTWIKKITVVLRQQCTKRKKVQNAMHYRSFSWSCNQ